MFPCTNCSEAAAGEGGGGRAAFVALHTKKRVRLKFVVGKVDPKVAAERAATMVGRGWKAIKVKVGQDPVADVARLEAVRRAIGPDVFLSVDANGGYTVDQAVWVARRFEELSVALFEQPTLRGDHRAMAQVRRRCGLPIMADESVFTPTDALDVIRHEAADVLSLYPGKHGGVRATQYIARMAEAAGIACTIGSNLEREVATAAMAHVTAATPQYCLRTFSGRLDWATLFRSPVVITRSNVCGRSAVCAGRGGVGGECLAGVGQVFQPVQAICTIDTDRLERTCPTCVTPKTFAAHSP